MDKGDLRGLQYVSLVYGIGWSQLIGLRNVTAHNYENIVDDVIWEIIH